MSDAVDGQIHRPVRVQTRHGVIEGYLTSSSMIRLLDDLNLVNHSFRTIQSPVVSDADWSVENSPLALHRDSIMFVSERDDAPPLPANHAAKAITARYARRTLRLRIGPFVVEGLVHVPPGGTALSRLFYERHPFLALTEATVTGHGVGLEVPFIAVNRVHVTAAQELVREATKQELVEEAVNDVEAGEWAQPDRAAG
jgi:hypothetical protein